jgi:hypothetical protein
MPERLARRYVVGRLFAAWLLAAGGAVAPLTATAHDEPVGSGMGVSLAAPPRETCGPGDTLSAGKFEICSPSAGGSGGGLNIVGLLPIVGGIVVAGAVALVVTYLVLRRRAGAPLDPVDAGEWWTCANCGRNNVVGSARCYSCGQWQR